LSFGQNLLFGQVILQHSLFSFY